MNALRSTALIVSLLAVASPAFASKARMQALGQDIRQGSFYIEDFRSIFLNPAYLNIKKNAVVTEWGESSDVSKGDSDEHPKAEGGIFGDYGSFTFGLYLGNNDAMTESIRDSKFLGQSNRVDLFVAGDAGILWGLNAYYADNEDNKDDIERSNTTYGLGIGTIIGNFEAYGDVGLKDLSEGALSADDKFDSDLKIKAGVTYRFSENVLNIEYNKASFDSTLSGVTNKFDHDMYAVKIGKIFSVNKTANIFVDLSYYNFDIDSSNGKYKGWAVPLNIAFETELCQYASFFGSVSQRLKSDYKLDGKKTSGQDSTAVVAGLRGHFGKFNIDGIIGRDSQGNSEGQFGTVSRIAVEYSF